MSFWFMDHKSDCNFIALTAMESPYSPKAKRTWNGGQEGRNLKVDFKGFKIKHLRALVNMKNNFNLWHQITMI